MLYKHFVPLALRANFLIAKSSEVRTFLRLLQAFSGSAFLIAASRAGAYNLPARTNGCPPCCDSARSIFLRNHLLPMMS
jgi:hypothetical protein